MKKKRMMSFMKKGMAGFLVAAVVIAGMALKPVTAKAAAYGSTTEQGDTYDDGIPYIDMTEKFKASWKEDGTGTAPVKKGYVFGGWYHMVNGSYVALDPETAKAKKEANVTEGIYAKFVPAYVLSVKAQLNADTKSANDRKKASIRLISSTDTLDYQRVGFTVVLNKKKNLGILETNKAYNRLQVGDNPENTYTADQVFGIRSRYFSVWRLDDIIDANDSKIICVTPYWITKDGTRVEGLTKYVHVEDGYLHYISVPVNIREAEDKVAAGVLRLIYDFYNLEVVNVEYGLFPDALMEYHDDSDLGVIKFAGNTDVRDTNVDANNIYANVRFKVKDSAWYEGSDLTDRLSFRVVDEDFCDWEQKEVSVDAWDIQY